MKKYLTISAIVIAGLILRLLFINKPDGMWNDEYISWMIASTPFGGGFVNAVKSQCHMPFYYLYLKFFMMIFGQSDIVLRLTSVFAGVLSIIAMFFAGREKDKQTGYLCAGFTAISSFLIYYSQEVRLYSVLFLFSALCLLFTLKCIKNPDKKNFILFGISNFLILFTHTIGFVFVFFNMIFISVNLYGKFKKPILYIWTAIAAGLILLSPLAVKIFSTQSYSQWWGHFSISKIGFLFTDYFSPVLTNLTNAPDKFLYMPKLALYMLLPTIIAIFCIIKSLIKNRENTGLFLVAAATTAVLTAAAISGKLVFITKYSIEIYPILILLACCGMASIKNKAAKIVLIVLYCLLSFAYLIISPYSAPKIRRPEGNKIMTDILNRMELQKGDIILLEYYPANRFSKYFDFSNYRVVEITKGNFPQYLSDNSYNDIYKNGKEIYKNIFLTGTNQYFDTKIQKEVINNLKPGQSVVLVILDSISYHTPQSLSQTAQNGMLYEKEPMLFLVFSFIKNKSFEDLGKTLVISSFAQRGKWTLIKFTKLNNRGNL